MPILTPKRDPFGKVTTPSPTYPTGPTSSPLPLEMTDYDVSSRMRELYQPEMSSSAMFDELLSNYPERNAPSPIRKIGASLAGLGPGGYELAHKAAYQPFYDELEDWKNRIEPAQEAMTNERMGNINLRTLANQIVSQELADKRLERAVARDKTLEEQGESRIKQTDQRIAIAKAVARGGRFTMDPSTGQGKIVFKDGTSIPVDIHQLPQEDLLELQQNYSLERIEETAAARTENRPRRTKTEVIEDPDNPGKKILVTVDLDTNEVVPATFKRPAAPGKDVTPVVKTSETEEAKGIDNRALQLKNSNPRWNKWIEMKNGKFIRIKRPGIISGPSRDEYNQIYQQIYGTPAPTTPTPTAKTGTVRVKAPDGRTGTWDLSKGPIPKGFTEIKEGAK